MRPARVYKVKIRENVLRQMIFTDKNILIGIIVLLTASVWFFGKSLPNQAKVFLSVILTGVVVLGLTAKIDRQPSYKVLFRTFRYIFNNKSKRI